MPFRYMGAIQGIIRGYVGVLYMIEGPFWVPSGAGGGGGFG